MWLYTLLPAVSVGSSGMYDSLLQNQKSMKRSRTHACSILYGKNVGLECCQSSVFHEEHDFPFNKRFWISEEKRETRDWQLRQSKFCWTILQVFDRQRTVTCFGDRVLASFSRWLRVKAVGICSKEASDVSRMRWLWSNLRSPSITSLVGKHHSAFNVRDLLSNVLQSWAMRGITTILCRTAASELGFL